MSDIEMQSMNLSEQSRYLESQLPAGGLFADKHWRQAVRPFPLPPSLVRELEEFGRILIKFYQALSQLYRFSSSGREPEFASRWLNLGKPQHLIDLQQQKSFIHAIPRVIRPDILLTDAGWVITELDSVPGGIGLTAWLNQTYSALGMDVIGGAADMIENFLRIFPPDHPVHIVVSQESATYRPEMAYLAAQSQSATNYRHVTLRDASFVDFEPGDSIYRFFELFDLENVPSANAIWEAALKNNSFVTPPPRPILEEKMSAALLWNKNLESFWHRELGGSYLEKMLKVVPRSWVMDPAPIPPHAAIPGLEITDWNQLKSLSQKKRQLILKVSGYSESAWGARGVHLGSDMPTTEWAVVVGNALRNFPHSPSVLQVFEKPKLVETSWISRDDFSEIPMKARVRLCPYYFVEGEGDRLSAHLSGVLATLCPSDKKIIHGMSDAVMAPCCLAQEN